MEKSKDILIIHRQKPIISQHCFSVAASQGFISEICLHMDDTYMMTSRFTIKVVMD